MSNVRAQMTCKAIGRTLVALQMAISFSAIAHDSAAFDGQPTSERCRKQSVHLSHLLAEREKGLSMGDALQISKESPSGELVPEATILDAYEFRWLEDGAHFGYFLWTCHARTLGWTYLPLSAVANDLSSCMKKRGDDPCGRAIRNRVVGIEREATPKP